MLLSPRALDVALTSWSEHYFFGCIVSCDNVVLRLYLHIENPIVGSFQSNYLTITCFLCDGYRPSLFLSQLEGRKIGVLPSTEQNSLFLENLPKGQFQCLPYISVIDQ